ncbi:hypothetical protein SNEBB_005259 [Seison nebaliae]|nr:hypothetical protein SNEBB_005259 [Seison nebaliae]
MNYFCLVFFFCALSISWCQPDELLIPFKRLPVKDTNLHVYKRYTYPGFDKSPGDIVHALPEVLVVPPIRKEIFSAGDNMIELTQLEARQVAEAQETLVKYLKSGNTYIITMIAYKRTLHMALVSFMTKIMIYLMSIKATYAKLRNTVFAGKNLNLRIKPHFDIFVQLVAASKHCMGGLRYGFDINQIHEKDIGVSAREFRYIFGPFINNGANQLSRCFLCSALLQSIVIAFKNMMQELFIPMCYTIWLTLKKPPMDVFKMLSIRQLKSKPVNILESEYDDQINYVLREYNNWQQLQTKNNPALYYLIMKSLSYVRNLEGMEIGDLLDKLSPDLREKAQEGLAYARLRFDTTEKLRNTWKGLTRFYTEYNLRDREHVYQVYHETLPSEETLIRRIIKPMAVFANKHSVVSAIIQVEQFSPERLARLFNPDNLLIQLAQKRPDIQSSQAGIMLAHRQMDIPLEEIPMDLALASLPIAQVARMEEEQFAEPERKRTISEGVRDADFYAGPPSFDEKFNEIMNFDPLAVKVNLFQKSLLEKLRFDERNRLIPTDKPPLENINPITYWPIEPTREQMTNQPGEPWDIFDRKQMEEDLKNEEIEHKRNILAGRIYHDRITPPRPSDKDIPREEVVGKPIYNYYHDTETDLTSTAPNYDFRLDQLPVVENIDPPAIYIQPPGSGASKRKTGVPRRYPQQTTQSSVSLIVPAVPRPRVVKPKIVAPKRQPCEIAAKKPKRIRRKKTAMDDMKVKETPAQRNARIIKEKEKHDILFEP